PDRETANCLGILQEKAQSTGNAARSPRAFRTGTGRKWRSARPTECPCYKPGLALRRESGEAALRGQRRKSSCVGAASPGYSWVGALCWGPRFQFGQKMNCLALQGKRAPSSRSIATAATARTARLKAA